MLLLNQSCLSRMGNAQMKTNESFKSKLILKSSEVRDELTSSADDNEKAPASPILLLTEWKNEFKCLKNITESQINPRFNTVRDELTFNADDNEHTSESPMKVFRKR